jgi:pyruvate/2-oxoglutarate dehydrogenase complex dihydrolipoamide acyltransferase (E2) component
MVTRVVMPPLGDTDAEAVVARWYKAEGEPVTKGEPLFEVETGKVSLDIEALGSGVLRRIVVAAGGEADVGDLLAYIADADDELPAA